MFWGRPPGDIPQVLDQQIPGQGQIQAPAMLPGVPARESHQENMIDSVNAVQEDRDEREVGLEQLQPLQDMMGENDDDMLGNQHLLNQHPPNQLDRRQQRQRPFQEESPEEVLAVLFSWNDDPHG